jgi:hypothetical protein
MLRYCLRHLMAEMLFFDRILMLAESPVLLGKMIRLSSVQGVTHVSGLGRSKESEAVQRCIDSLLKHGITKHHVTTAESALGFRSDLVS